MILRTVHPPKALAWDHLEIEPLVAILCVHHVRKFDGIELLQRGG